MRTAENGGGAHRRSNASIRPTPKKCVFCRVNSDTLYILCTHPKSATRKQYLDLSLQRPVNESKHALLIPLRATPDVMQALQLAARRLAGPAITSQLRSGAARGLSNSSVSQQALPAVAEDSSGGAGSDRPLHQALLLDAAGTLLSPSEPAAEVLP